MNIMHRAGAFPFGANRPYPAFGWASSRRHEPGCAGREKSAAAFPLPLQEKITLREKHT